MNEKILEYFHKEIEKKAFIAPMLRAGAGMLSRGAGLKGAFRAMRMATPARVKAAFGTAKSIGGIALPIGFVGMSGAGAKSNVLSSPLGVSARSIERSMKGY